MSWCDTCPNGDMAECIGCDYWRRSDEPAARPVGRYIQYRNSSGGFTTAGPFTPDEAKAFRERLERRNG